MILTLNNIIICYFLGFGPIYHTEVFVHVSRTTDFSYDNEHFITFCKQKRELIISLILGEDCAESYII